MAVVRDEPVGKAVGNSVGKGSPSGFDLYSLAEVSGRAQGSLLLRTSNHPALALLVGYTYPTPTTLPSRCYDCLCLGLHLVPTTNETVTLLAIDIEHGAHAPQHSPTDESGEG